LGNYIPPACEFVRIMAIELIKKILTALNVFGGKKEPKTIETI
jgi:hypothetical protein